MGAWRARGERAYTRVWGRSPPPPAGSRCRAPWCEVREVPKQARRAPQRGLGKHYRRALLPPPLILCLTCEEVSPYHPTRVSGERRKLSQRGTGRSPGRKWILCISQKEAIWNTIFSIFERRRPPLQRRGARENLSPPPTSSRRACSEAESSLSILIQKKSH